MRDIKFCHDPNNYLIEHVEIDGQDTPIHFNMSILFDIAFMVGEDVVEKEVSVMIVETINDSISPCLSYEEAEKLMNDFINEYREI